MQKNIVKSQKPIEDKIVPRSAKIFEKFSGSQAYKSIFQEEIEMALKPLIKAMPRTNPIALNKTNIKKFFFDLLSFLFSTF